MKLVIDEKLKHRLIGLAVIISLGAIFAPAIMKKSSQRIDGNFSVNVNLPPKPLAPDVITRDESELFKTIKVAKVSIPSVSNEKQLPGLVKAESIKSPEITKNRTRLAEQDKLNNKSVPLQRALNQTAKSIAHTSVQISGLQGTKSKPTTAFKKQPIDKTATTIQVAKASKVPYKPQIKKVIYSVQLATFTQATNAKSLVNKLKIKGYKANFVTSPGRKGTIYKVYAGHSSSKMEAIKIQNQLVSAMQLRGIIVNTGVS